MAHEKMYPLKLSISHSLKQMPHILTQLVVLAAWSAVPQTMQLERAPAIPRPSYQVDNVI